MEYGVPVFVVERFLSESKYSTRTMPPDVLQPGLAARITEPWFTEDDPLPAEKEETLQ
jgi:hypothetical protein